MITPFSFMVLMDTNKNKCLVNIHEIEFIVWEESEQIAYINLKSKTIMPVLDAVREIIALLKSEEVDE